MNNELTQEQVDFYQDNGYIVIEDFLTPEELETWRQRVDDAVARRWKPQAGLTAATWTTRAKRASIAAGAGQQPKQSDSCLPVLQQRQACQA